MSSIHIQVNGHIGLGPTLLSSMRSDAFSQLHQKGMIASGHASILGVLFSARVWHARHHGISLLVDAPATIRLSAVAASRETEHTANAGTQDGRDADFSDETLIAQVCAGSREALSVLFGRYSRLVRTVAMRILRDDSEADDLLQEVFLFVHRNCSRFDSSKSALRSWIVQMTYHRAIDRRRYLNSRYFYTRLDLDEAAGLSDPGLESREETLPLGSLVGNTTMQGLLDSLTEDQHNTLSLHFVEGYTFDEIAAKLDQSLGNVRNHYYRGLEKLRRQMFPGKLPGRNGYGRK